MQSLISRLAGLCHRRSGTTMVEYTLFLALIAVASLALASLLGVHLASTDRCLVCR